MADPPLWASACPCLGVRFAGPHPCSHAWLCHDSLLKQGRCWGRDVSQQLAASWGSFLALCLALVPKEGRLPPSQGLSLAFFPRQLPRTSAERTLPALLPPRT